MISGFLNLFIGKIEEKNPAAVYGSCDSRTHQDLSRSEEGNLQHCFFLRNKTENELEAMIKDLETVNLELEGATPGKKRLVQCCLKNKSLWKRVLQTKERNSAGISKQAEDSMEQLQQFEVEIQNLKREKDEMLAKEANADAQIKIQETLSSLSVDADIQALANVRESIDKKAAEAKVGAELADNNLDNKLANLREEGAKSRARAKFEAARQARLAKESGQTAQTAQTQSTGPSNDTPPPPSGNSGGKTI